MKCRSCAETIDVSTEFEFDVKPDNRWELVEYKVAECGCVTLIVDRKGHRIFDMPDEWSRSQWVEDADSITEDADGTYGYATEQVAENRSNEVGETDEA